MTAEQDAEQLWLGELRVQIIDPRKETPGAVSYTHLTLPTICSV